MLDLKRHGKMMNWYLDLCKQKGIEVQSFDNFTANTLYDEIQRLKDLPYLATDGQKRIITQLMDEIGEIKGKKQKLSVDINTLTGGRDGTACLRVRVRSV